MSPSVSVVIVAYNKADTIAAAIESVLRQTYGDFEVLVIDDGSTDSTGEKVRPFGARVRYVRKENGGTGSARNLGISLSRGQFIAFLDGDDLWLPKKLEAQMEAFRREPGAAAVQCGVYCVNDELEPFEERICRPQEDHLLNFLLFKNLPGFSSAVVVRRGLFDRIGGFGTDLVILSDWDMAIRIALAGTLRSIPEPLVLYRHYPGNQSRNVEIHIDSGRKSLTRFFSNRSMSPAVHGWRRRVWAQFYAMLAGGYARNREWAKAVPWALKALASSPAVLPYMAGMPMRGFRRLFKGRTFRSFAEDFPYAFSRSRL
ncbi:MAG: glycosyltransferase family 2 protein [Candidatus Omnitrophica bacterium]|nr:glycosyltransferase family 2 protein [Candidatus Omnitrophota bacterium]